MKQYFGDIPVYGDPDLNSITQIETCRKFMEGCALNGDHHLGYSAPIGAVCWSQELISPSIVGVDICCGNLAVKLDANPTTVIENISEIMDEVFATIPFGMGRNANWKIDHELFDSPVWDLIEGFKDPNLKDLRNLSKIQLGTVGGGNHYVDIFIDENQEIWCGVHFGSRGLGYKIANHFFNRSNYVEDVYADPIVFHQDSPNGQEYLACISLASQYANAGREAVCTKVAEILGAKIMMPIHNHHNHCWRESHPDNGLDYWVMRKGATPAYPGQLSFVGSSMAEPSYILMGKDHPDSKELFYSTVHGAGRKLSRSQAKGKVNRKTGELILGEDNLPKRAPLVTREMMLSTLTDHMVCLRGADVDEAPQCYKRLNEVLDWHKNTVEVIHTLTPLGVAMAGSGEFDPYKD